MKGSQASFGYLSVATKFAESVESYRIISQSVTAELIAPALSNQGSVVAGQYINPVQKSYASRTTEASIQSVMMPIRWYDQPPPQSYLALGTVAYTGQATQGLYMPLKLTDFSVRHANRSAFHIESPVSLPAPFIPGPAGTTGYPFYGAAGPTPIPVNSGEGIGIVYFNGLSVNASIRIRVRQSLEVFVRPGTPFAPLTEAPLPPDELAVRMYSEISGKLKDAYPASYNDLGKLKEQIVAIAKKVLPYVDPALSIAAAMPGIPGAAASAVRSMLEAVRSRGDRKDSPPPSSKHKKKKALATRASAVSQRKQKTA